MSAGRLGLRLGAAFPHQAPGFAHGADSSVVFTAAAEDLGIGYLTISDHVVGADPAGRPDWSGRYTNGHPFREALTHLAYLAALTRLELMPAVLVLPQRPTALTAKQAAELSHLCRGGLRLGVGIGWNAVEYAALGATFADRGARFEEQLSVLRQLWRDPVVTVHTRYHHLDRVAITPRPAAPIPLWIGGGNNAGPAIVRRVADRVLTHGEGWVSAPGTDVDQWARVVDALRGRAAQLGRDPDGVGVQLSLNLPPDGAPDDLRRALDQVLQLGPTHLTLDTRAGQRSAAQHIDDLAAAVDVVRESTAVLGAI